MDDCFIGIASIPDKYNQYRLGTIFLRNFYTGLNFDKNMLLIGLNKGTVSAELHGKAENPFKPVSSSGAVVFVVIFLIVMFLIALVCFIRAKKNEKDRLVTFAPTTSDDIKKRYRNGVEIKPSEISKT